MGYTIEVKTERYGIWHVTNIVFATPEEAGRYIHELSERWPSLVQEWQVIETMVKPTHNWGRISGLEDRQKPESASDSDK